MTEVVDLVEDILSEEYEEGEILDEDILYENVSSLEEFSDPEDKKLGNKAVKSDGKKFKHRRKKEHKCKDDSVCRKERTGKHCYARIRKRRSSQDSKSKNSTAKGSILELDKKPRPAARPISPTRGSAKRDSFCKDTTKIKGKQDDRPRYPPYYFQHDNRIKVNPPRRNTVDRRPARTRRFSADDRRDNDRKRKSRSPSPRPSVKHLHEASRAVAKTSLLDRLVGSGSIPQKGGVNCESDDSSTKTVADPEQQTVSNSESNQDTTEGPENIKLLDTQPTLKRTIGVNVEVCEEDVDMKDDVACQSHILSPEDIPVPPTPKATSPVPEHPKEEIDELHLRLVALKTAIMKKQNDFKRKKRLAASKKVFELGNDSFTEFALTGVGDDEESIPTPPPPGTDSWPASTIRDLDDPRWSDEDMVIDQESNYGDTIIEANIPASDPSLQNYVRHSASSPSSQDKLPCCKGNPIPVVSPHRPAKEVEERRPALNSSTSVLIPVQEIRPPLVPKETPKYLKEISSNLKAGMKRRRRGRPQRRYRRNSTVNRARTPAVRRGERSIQHREIDRSVPLARKSRVFEGDDDEDALRQLALMSVKPKNSITGGMLAEIGKNLNPLHIETDPVALEIKPESPAKNPSPAEGWEDIDEDILRAQLLSSLSRSIPVAPSQPEIPPSLSIPVQRVVVEHKMTLRKDVLTKRLNKENLYTKRNVIVHHNNTKPTKRNTKKYINPNVKGSLTPPMNPPVIEKFIIKVSESDTSEDDEKNMRGKIVSDFESAVIGQQLDLESSIDRLLEEARRETELIQKATPYYPMYDVGLEVLADVKEETTSPTLCDVTVQEIKNEVPSPVELSHTSQPEIPCESAVVNRENEDENSIQPSQGTSHLPAWQQEEFERQKRVMVKKESVIAAAREKILAKNSLAVGTASEKLTEKEESSSPSGELNKTDSVSHVGEADPTTTDSPKKTEETKDCCDLSSVNTGIVDFNLKVDSAVSSNSDDLYEENEVKSCMEFIISKVCGETESLGTCETLTEVTSDSTAAADSSKSVTVSHHDSQLPSKSLPSNPDESSKSSKPNAANISSVVVSPLKNPKLPVSRPAVHKASANVASTTQGLSSQQMKKLLLKRMSEFSNAVSSPTSAARAATKPGKEDGTIKSAVRESVKPTSKKKSQLPIMTNAKQLVNSLPNAIAHAAVGKSLFAVKDSSYALKGLNEMTDLVAGLENGMTEYRNLRKDFIAQRKQLMLIQQKISKKRQQLLEMKDTIENKKRLLQSTISMDTSSLSPLPDTRDQPKQSTRTSELLTLKFKEVCLKAQFAMMGLETASRPQAAVKMSRPAEDVNQSPRKKMKMKVRPPGAKVPLEPALSSKVLKTRQSECTDPGTTHKLVVSVRDKDKMDPLIPLCPYDIKGVCKDEECEYQHLKN